MKIIKTAQFRQLTGPQQPTTPDDAQQVETEVPSAEALVDEPIPDANQIISDFERGVNIAPMASAKGQEKTAGLKTPHFRHTTFISCFSKLPNEIKNLARTEFSRMIANPKAVSPKKMPGLQANLVSVPIGPHYRALGCKVGPYYIWHWIGSHEAYNRQKSARVPNVSLPPAARKALLPQQEA